MTTRFVLTRDPSSFCRENLIVVVIVLRVLQESRGGGNKLSNFRGFVILRPGESITSFNKDNTQC